MALRILHIDPDEEVRLDAARTSWLESTEPIGAYEVDDRIRYPGLPLAVYREVAAHLEQVDGVTVELLPQQSQQFDYRLSQIDSLRIIGLDDTNTVRCQQVQQILAYYSDRYGAWEAVKSDNTWG